MKKILSFMLAAMLLVSAVPMVYAADVDYTQGTAVTYTATGTEAYTVTVPAQLAPGGSGTVTLSGTWADNRVVTVTADPTVTLTNSIKAEDKKVLNVNFDGISEAGSNTTSQTFTAPVSVDGISNALFGTWSGKFNYNVECNGEAGGSESGGGSNESGSEGSIGYTANFVVDANLPEIACIINGSTYKINELPSAVINVDTIEFFYGNIGAPSKGMQWDIGTSSGSNDIGTIKAGDSTRLTYTMTADTTIFIKESSTTTSTFTIAGTEYEFEEGMTWADWVDSEYNTDGYYIASNSFINHPISKHICYDMKAELSTNAIVADRQYYIGIDKIEL